MVTRRTCLAAGPAALLASSNLSNAKQDGPSVDPGAPLPHKAAFAPMTTTYLNNGAQHPARLDGIRAIQRYLEYKSYATNSSHSDVDTYFRVLDRYAALINADAREVAFVQSTTVGENLVLKALGIPESGGRVITDDLHYSGSLPTYAQLAERGVDVVVLRAGPDGSIAPTAFEAALTDDTRLIAVSLVSMVNGFVHDLDAICRMAHDRDVPVYADVIHAVGAMPFDVRASGVDFCSAASYKWLMGEQGLGFLYARADRLPTLVRPWFGHYQLARRESLGFPHPDQGADYVDFAHEDSARGMFAMGSQANIVAALLDDSLDYIHAVGPERIAAHRRPLIERLQERLPSAGFARLTPPGTDSPLVSFRHDGNTERLDAALAAARLTIRVASHHVRISPSVFNDMDDIDRLVDVLAGA